ncbi:type IV pilus assembly protein PilM [bacterium]|nr:MAG: type IV pilus assembly protein PilM [bacterium]
MTNFVGLDIGNYKIKISQIEWRKGKPVLIALGETDTPNGTMGSDDENQQKLLASKIEELFHESKVNTRKVVAALPEISVTSRLEIGFPKLEEDALNEAIIYEAKKYISYPLEEMQIDKMIIGERDVNNEKKLDIFWVATSKSNVNRFIKICKYADLEILALETESIATARTIKNFSQQGEVVVIVDVGSNGTEISVARDGILLSSQTVGIGSDAITRTIENSFGIDYIKAEEIKRTYGMNKEVVNGKIADVIEPAVNLMFVEINKTINFFKARLPEAVPTRIFYVGDGSRMPGLIDASNTSLNIPSFLLNSFKGLSLSSNLKDRIKSYSGIGFNVSVGLGLKVDN